MRHHLVAQHAPQDVEHDSQERKGVKHHVAEFGEHEHFVIRKDIRLAERPVKHPEDRGTDE